MKRVAAPTTDRRPAGARGRGARRVRPEQPRAQARGSTAAAGGGQAASVSEHLTLSKYIRARFDECSRSQKDVAQYIVDHLDEAAFQTAEELARRANTSSSTVVRLSQALGFEGFPELQAAAREEYRRVHASTGPAQTAAITDATLSEVAKLAHIKLYYSSNSPAFVRSHAALLSLVQALAYGVYAQDSAQYDDRIKAFRLK